MQGSELPKMGGTVAISTILGGILRNYKKGFLFLRQAYKRKASG